MTVTLSVTGKGMPGLILVHLDRAAVRELERALGDCDSNPTALAEPESALDLLTEAPDTVAAVIVDAGIADPLRFAQRARALDPNLPMVLATGPGDGDDVRRALCLTPGLGNALACVALDDLPALCEVALAAVGEGFPEEASAGASETGSDGVDATVGQSLLAGDCGHLLDQAPIGVIAADAAGGIRGWNRCARMLLERSERESLGSPLPLLFSGPQRIQLRMLLASAVAGDAPEACTFVRTRHDGERQFLEVTAAAHAGYGGAGALLLLQEVTAREQALDERDGHELALRESERRFRAVFEQAASGIALVSPEGCMTAVNERFCQLVGYGRDELTGMSDPIVGLTHPDDVEVELAYMGALVAGEGAPFQLEKRFRHRAGHEVWARLGVSALRDETGGIQQLIAVAENIDERKRAEAALQASEERQRLILESLTNYAVFTTDLAGHVTDWNRGAERLLGYAESEIVGRSVDIILPHEEQDAEAHAGELQEALAEGQSADDRWHVRKDGTRFWASGLTNTLGGDGTPRGFVKVLRDRTESKRSRDQLEARARQQAAVARFGQRALSDVPVEQLFREAVQIIAETLEVPLASLFQLLPDEGALTLEAGVGWSEGLLGRAWIGAERESQAGYTLASAMPVVVEDLRTETRFHPSPLLREAGAVSGITVAVSES
ncbi:MAG: PAS domain S-box protein, partial [Halofilum sp. (in: g-proteobacteria)]